MLPTVARISALRQAVARTQEWLIRWRDDIQDTRQQGLSPDRPGILVNSDAHHKIIPQFVDESAISDGEFNPNIKEKHWAERTGWPNKR